MTSTPESTVGRSCRVTGRRSVAPAPTAPRSGADVRAVVGLPPGLSPEPARPGEVHARVLACVGADDPFCPRDQRAAFKDEIMAAGVDWQLFVLAGTKHGFTVPEIDPAKHPDCAYHAASDRRSWRAMLALFDESLAA